MPPNIVTLTGQTFSLEVFTRRHSRERVNTCKWKSLLISCFACRIYADYLSAARCIKTWPELRSANAPKTPTDSRAHEKAIKRLLQLILRKFLDGELNFEQLKQVVRRSSGPKFPARCRLSTCIQASAAHAYHHINKLVPCAIITKYTRTGGCGCRGRLFARHNNAAGSLNTIFRRGSLSVRSAPGNWSDII
jgi:hypothetical protein